MRLDLLPRAVSLLLVLALAGCAEDEEKTKPLPPRLYVCDDGAPNTVSAYEVAAGGALTPLEGSPFATGGDANDYGGQSNCIRIHVASRRLYAVNRDSVSVFGIDEVTGALALLPGSPSVIASTGLYSLEISRDGNTVFLPDTDTGAVHVASVGADGTLTPIEGSPFSGSGGASVAELSRDGRFLYVQPEDDYLDVFSVGASGLALTASSPYTTTGSGWTARLSHGGAYLALGVDGLAIFALDAATGTPAEAAGSPFGGLSVGALAWTPDDRRIYAASWGGDEVHGFAVGAGGVLTALEGSPWSFGHGSPGSLTVSSDGKLLFMPLEDDGSIAVFALDAAGTPTELEGSPFAGNGSPSYAIATP